MAREGATASVLAAILHKMDQALFEFGAITPPPSHDLLSHFKGQLYLGCATLLIKRAVNDQEAWRNISQQAGLLFLEAYGGEVVPQQKIIGGVRKVIAGHMLQLLAGGDSQWVERVVISSNMVERLHEAVFVVREQRDKINTSCLAQLTAVRSCSTLPTAAELLAHCPAYITRYSCDLHMLVWLLVCYYSPGKVLDFNFDLPAAESAAPMESLTSLDLHSFLYALVYCLGQNIETEGARMPPLTPNLSPVVTSTMQEAWWNVASKVGTLQQPSDKKTLQHGVEAIRCTGQNGLDIDLSMKLGKTFQSLSLKAGSKDQGEVEMVNMLEERACIYYRASLVSIEMNKDGGGLAEPCLRLLQAAGSTPSQGELEEMEEAAHLFLNSQLPQEDADIDKHSEEDNVGICFPLDSSVDTDEIQIADDDSITDCFHSDNHQTKGSDDVNHSFSLDVSTDDSFQVANVQSTPFLLTFEDFQVADDIRNNDALAVNSPVKSDADIASLCAQDLSVFDFHADNSCDTFEISSDFEIANDIETYESIKEPLVRLACCELGCCTKPILDDLKVTLKTITNEKRKIDIKNELLRHLKSQKQMGLSTASFFFGGLHMCPKFFSEISGVSPYIIKQVMEDFENDLLKYEHGNQGNFQTSSACTGFLCWMRSFSEVYGQSAPDEETCVLPSFLAIKDLFEIYNQEVEEPKVKFTTFYHLFKKFFGWNRVDHTFPHIRLSTWSTHSRCDQCIAINRYRRSCRTEESLAQAASLKLSHKTCYGKARIFIENLRHLSLTFPDSRLFIQIDDMGRGSFSNIYTNATINGISIFHLC